MTPMSLHWCPNGANVWITTTVNVLPFTGSFSESSLVSYCQLSWFLLQGLSISHLQHKMASSLSTQQGESKSQSVISSPLFSENSWHHLCVLIWVFCKAYINAKLDMEGIYWRTCLWRRQRRRPNKWEPSYSLQVWHLWKRQIGGFSGKCFRLPHRCLLNLMVGITG